MGAALLHKAAKVIFPSRMQERKFKIVKLTPIALASCERCNTTFQSYQRIEDEAEREMKALFDRHHCGAAGIPGEND